MAVLNIAPPVDRPKQDELRSIAEIGSRMPIGISAFGSWMLGVGTIIGSMAWLIHGCMLARSGTLPTLAAWIVAALMNIPLALALAELSSMFPSAGGPYIYKYIAFKRMFPAYGEFIGFSTGWLYWIAMLTGVACMANGFAALVASAIWPSGSSTPIWFGPLSIVFLFAGTTLMNLTKIANASKLNNLLTLGKLALAAAFIGLVISVKPHAVNNLLSHTAGADTTFIGNVMAVLILAITAFSGIELVGCTSSETINPRRNIPRAVFLTLATVALVYVGLAVSICAASTYVATADGSTMHIPGTNFQATCPSVAAFLGGPVWGAILTGGVIVSIVACSFNALLALARISYSMSETKLFPARFAKLDSRDSVPKDALWFLFGFLCLLGVGANVASKLIAGFDAYTFLGEVFGFLYSCLAVLYGICLISLRYTEPSLPRPFRLGASGNRWAWVMGLAVVVVYGFVASQCAQTCHQLTALGLLLAGVPVYCMYRRSSKVS